MKEKPNLLIVCGVNAASGEISMPEPIDITPYSDYHIEMCIIDNFAAYSEKDLEALFPGIIRYKLSGVHANVLEFINSCVNHLRILNHNGMLASVYVPFDPVIDEKAVYLLDYKTDNLVVYKSNSVLREELKPNSYVNTAEVRTVITVKTKNNEECKKVMESFHNTLVGYEDYQENRIILNDSETRKLVDPADTTENEVHLYVFDDCFIDVIPTLKIIK